MEARIAELEAKVAAQERQIAELTRLLKVQKPPTYNFAADEPQLYRWDQNNADILPEKRLKFRDVNDIVKSFSFS